MNTHTEHLSAQHLHHIVSSDQFTPREKLLARQCLRLLTNCPACAKLRAELADSTGDVHEAVLRKLGLWPYFGRKYHALGMYWSGVPTVDLPCDFCTLSVTEHDPRTHDCPDKPFPMLIRWVSGGELEIINEIPKGRAFKVIAKNLQLTT